MQLFSLSLPFMQPPCKNKFQESTLFKLEIHARLGHHALLCKLPQQQSIYTCLLVTTKHPVGTWVLNLPVLT